MKLKNSAGYTLLEMIIVLSITATILLFFSHSLMNNFRFIHRSQKNSPAYIKLLVFNTVQKDYEKCFKIETDVDRLEMEVPFLEDENEYSVRQVDYRIITNTLVRKETGKTEKTKILDLGSLSMSFNWAVISKVSNLMISCSDTNGQTEEYNLGALTRKGIKQK